MHADDLHFLMFPLYKLALKHSFKNLTCLLRKNVSVSLLTCFVFLISERRHTKNDYKWMSLMNLSYQELLSTFHFFIHIDDMARTMLNRCHDSLLHLPLTSEWSSSRDFHTLADQRPTFCCWYFQFLTDISTYFQFLSGNNLLSD